MSKNEIFIQVVVVVVMIIRTKPHACRLDYSCVGIIFLVTTQHTTYEEELYIHIKSKYFYWHDGTMGSRIFKRMHA